jgi:hypothetical protein
MQTAGHGAEDGKAPDADDVGMLVAEIADSGAG